MTIQAFRFLPDTDPIGPVPTPLPLDAQGAPSRSRCEYDLAAFVITRDDLERLAKQFNIAIRKEKNKSKPLSFYLLGRREIPLFLGGYKNAGQMIRSIKKMLEHAVQRAEKNIYIIGVAPLLYEELHARIAGSEGIQRGTPGVMLPSREKRMRIANAASQAMLELMENRDAPKQYIEEYIGKDPQVHLVRQMVFRVAQNAEPVLILGETGTGKEVVARMIHNCDTRRDAPFMAINCAGIPPYLLESELFGYMKGTHATAFRNKVGLWKAAGHGTLFLDEIGDLSLDHQAKILRALQENKILPIGAVKPIPVHARVIAATNRDLFSMVQDGRFRDDLYYRLRTFLIRTPALREHPDDIPALAGFFWQKITKNPAAVLPAAVVSALQECFWPGNGRDLRGVLACLYGLFGEKNLTPTHLHAVRQFQSDSSPAARELLSKSEANVRRAEGHLHLRRVDDVLRAIEIAMRPLSDRVRLDTALIEFIRLSLRNHLEELEMLCEKPLKFLKASTYDIACRIKGKLLFFYSLFEKNPEKAKVFWRQELKGMLKPISGMKS
jgi:DNA-binding NtrC family response regulator